MGHGGETPGLPGQAVGARLLEHQLQAAADAGQGRPQLVDDRAKEALLHALLLAPGRDVADDAEDLPGLAGHDARLEILLPAVEGEMVFDRARLPGVEHLADALEEGQGLRRRQDLGNGVAQQLLGRLDQIVRGARQDLQVGSLAILAEQEIRQGLEHELQVGVPVGSLRHLDGRSRRPGSSPGPGGGLDQLQLGPGGQVLQGLPIRAGEGAGNEIDDAERSHQGVPAAPQGHARVEPDEGRAGDEGVVGEPLVEAGIFHHEGLPGQNGVAAERQVPRRFDLVQPLPGLEPQPGGVHQAHEGHGRLELPGRRPDDAIEALLLRRVQEAEAPQHLQTEGFIRRQGGRLHGGGRRS